MKKVAVILSGCGYLDGAEIRESVLTLLYLDALDCEVTCFAPNIAQMHVVNHQTGEEVPGESRNILEESARISRGKMKELGELKADAFDALVIPGGFGVAKNLSDLAVNGTQAKVLPEFNHAIREFVQHKKPVGAICISPAVLAAALTPDYSPTLTIGEDEATASVIEHFGGIHQNCSSDEIVVDEELKIVTCSAYMREDRLSAIAKGIEKLIQKVLSLA